MIITVMVICAFWIMGSKSHSSNQKGHFKNIVCDRSSELFLTKLVRYFRVSVFQGQPGELHFFPAVCHLPGNSILVEAGSREGTCLHEKLCRALSTHSAQTML